MLLDTWACIKIGPGGPSVIDPNLVKILQMTAAEMYTAGREKFRQFRRSAYTGVVTTEWYSYSIDLHARGVLFNASVIETRVMYEVNFLLDLPDLDKMKLFIEFVEAYEGGWKPISSLVSEDVHSALTAFSKDRPMN